MSNTSFSIVIPKPCHEDWNKMTPDQKGAFCGSCQKSVYDFTGKTDEEVIEILEKNKDKKICGRFDTKQLERPIEKTIPNYLIQTNYSRLQAFAMALFLVFGSMLFNCETASAQKVGKIKVTEKPIQQHVTGEMVEEPVIMTGDTVIVEPKAQPVLGGPKFVPVKPNTNNNAIKNGATTLKPVRQHEEYKMMGDVCVMPIKGEMKVVEKPKPVEKPIQKDTTEKEVLMGKVAFNSFPELEDTVKVIPPPVIKKDTVIAPEPKDFYPIMGMIAYRPEHPVTDPIPDKDPIVVKDSVIEDPIIPVVIKDTAAVIKVTPVIPEVIDPKDPILEVMPNPSNGKLTLRYTLKEKNVTVIELYNINGDLVRTFIASQQLYNGIYTSSFDITDLQDGIYICQMRSGERTVSSKVILTK